MSGEFRIDYEQAKELEVRLAKAGDAAEQVVNDTLHNFAGKEIMENIIPLLPESGRTWKGKRAAASKTQPFKQENSNLAVTVKSKPIYNYLYFPDDGSNTIKHAGNLHFMHKGAENAADAIIRKCNENIVNVIERS